jgi:UDP-glucose 4-epimerase
MARCLVVGGNGFLGSHLVDTLVSSGHDVSVFDRFRGGALTYESTGVRQIVGDFLNRTDLEAAVQGIDLVFHFLSATTPATAESDPTLDIRTNVVQSVELFRACAAAGVERIFFASTGGAIYGNQGLSRYSEEMPANPVSPYGIGKLTIEHYLEYFRATTGIEYTILRISNPYGPRQRKGRKQGLIPIALGKILAGEPVVVFGDGSMVRDYIYVGDLVAMVEKLSHGQNLHDIYNLGSGEGLSVKNVLSTLREVTGRDFHVENVTKPKTFVDSVVLDTGRYRSEFAPGFALTLDEGVRRTWHAMQDSD